jgi:hypothetical protein
MRGDLSLATISSGLKPLKIRRGPDPLRRNAPAGLPVPVGPRHRRCPVECHLRTLARNLFTALGSIRMAFSTRKWGNFLCSQSA